MRFFKYSPKIRTGLLWNQLHSLASTKKTFKKDELNKYEHTSDIVTSALNGSFDINQTGFNHLAYEARSRSHDDISVQKKRSKVWNIIDSSSSEEEAGPQYGDVLDSKVLKDFEEAFDEIECSETLRKGIEVLVDYREKISREYGLDVMVSFRMSLYRNPDAVEAIRELCESDEEVKDTITDVLESSSKLNKAGSDIDLGELLKEKS